MKEDFSSQSQIEPRASGDIAFAVLCMFGELAHSDQGFVRNIGCIHSRRPQCRVSNTAQIYIVRERYNGLRRPAAIRWRQSVDASGNVGRNNTYLDCIFSVGVSVYSPGRTGTVQLAHMDIRAV